ncbi:MAG: thiol oxidoreductase [Saprospiraceae bacterium]|nr:thiol oxidoreductase [Saprospiraceae bacterium]
MKYLIFVFAIFSVAILGCKPDSETAVQEDEDLKLGGETSITGAYIQVFQQPAPNMSALELDLHRAADRAFGDKFVTAPAIINGGLGPIFNQNACENCHVSNGRSPFPESSQDLRGLLIRLSVAGSDVHGGPLNVPNFGGQLQTKALFGKTPEASLTWQYVQEVKTFLDGESISLSKPVFVLENPYEPLPTEMMTSPRIAPPVIGLGLLEAIKESDIMALTDPEDADKDGISGRANQVWDVKNQRTALGRFGWKAGQPDLSQQTAAAYQQDMGITNPLFPIESSLGQSQLDALQDDPEINEATLKAATFYTQSLAVPQRRNTTDPNVIEGKKLFFELKCGSCHHYQFVTGDHPEYVFLSRQTIFPYTDLLLHDMGDGLADNRPEFLANGREWRTPPLWGLGLTQVVGGIKARYLHDGRAATLQEAIMWHGGEAEQSKEQFRKLSKSERQALVSFLESL